jgi:hypothetical protein
MRPLSRCLEVDLCATSLDANDDGSPLTYCCRIRRALGQLLRTAYLCDYFTLPDFRRSVYQELERGESVHALQRQICTQALPAERGRRAEELLATSGALTLVTKREAERTAPRYSIDALKSMGPVGHRHINFRGTYRFAIAIPNDLFRQPHRRSPCASQCPRRQF